jgi:sigma-B regulation protein RsbU (phosphoserine phosphatase)
MQELLRQVVTLSELQKHLLPRHTPQLPGWQVAVHYAVGLLPGGDYYDFLGQPDGRLLLLVADASDSGGPSVVLDALVRSVLHSCPLSSGIERLPFCPLHETMVQPPHVILGHLNRVLVENSLAEQYMTAFCGMLSPADGELHYANAGHLEPRWWRKETRTVESLPLTPGMPLGLMAHASYHHRRVDLQPGDVLVCYSDGLTAALSPRGQPFGVGRLDELLVASAADGALAVSSALQAGLKEFLGPNPAQDDVTLVVLERES